MSKSLLKILSGGGGQRRYMTFTEERMFAAIAYMKQGYGRGLRNRI